MKTRHEGPGMERIGGVGRGRRRPELQDEELNPAQQDRNRSIRGNDDDERNRNSGAGEARYPTRRKSK